MPGYATTQHCIAISGVADLQIRALRDTQQYADADGSAARLGIGAATWPLFGVLWPSAALLAARLAARMALRGWRAHERILEVGCGLALASLVGHRRGADVTASDSHPLAAQFLAHNLALNGLPPMAYRHGDWVLPTAAPDGARWTGTLRGRFDLLIGSDVLYDRDASAALAGFIGRHAADDAEVWIVDPDRGNRAGFSAALSRLGFALGQSRLDAPAGDGRAAYKGRLLRFVRGAAGG